MDGTELAEVIQSGEQLFTIKLLLIALQCLWMYDYLLTFGDEVQYAWHGRKTWIFALFVANRYIPVIHLIWVHVTMFHYSQPFCQHTKWIPVLQSSTTTSFAQIAVALRVYAITWKNNIIGGILAILVAFEVIFGIFSMIWIGLGPLQPLPDLELDEFKICLYKLWNLGELIYYNLSMAFDVIVFLVIIIAARRPRMNNFPGMPSILDTLVRDATQYFILIFSFHFLATLSLFVTPANIQLFPGMANSILVPIMASRLMLSLKKASVRPGALWSLETMTNAGSGRQAEGGPRRDPGRFHEIPLTPTALGEQALELDVTC